MAQIILTRQQALDLQKFCEERKITKYFIAKDHGAYLGASLGKGNNMLFHFPGCDPEKDPLWYENAEMLFGGDDFGEHLELESLSSALAAGALKIRWSITSTEIKMEYLK